MSYTNAKTTGVNAHTLTEELIEMFATHLYLNECSGNTISRYLYALRHLLLFLLSGRPSGQESDCADEPDSKNSSTISKEEVLLWKAHLHGYLSANSVNAMLSAVNSFFRFMDWQELCVKLIRVQRQIYRDVERELSKEEYIRLLETAKAKGKIRLCYIMETLAATGIRISELSYITVESLGTGRATVDCKGKQRTVILPPSLRQVLSDYCAEKNITSGPVFVTRNGKSVDRSNIWREMKALCDDAQVNPHKVFPHNFRHFFAVAYYRQEKDIVKLADILGHTSINTTRIYIMESGAKHEQQIERLGFVL